MPAIQHTKTVTLHMSSTVSIEELRKFVEEAEALIKQYPSSNGYVPRICTDNSIEHCDGEDCTSRYEQFGGLKMVVPIPEPVTT